ncbi:MAG: TIM barrel protein [Candidatus Bathyarchaeia archaeon]
MVGKPRVGVSLYSYGADIMTRRMTIKECIEHAASLGVEGIEIVDNRHLSNYPYHSVYDLLEMRDYIESFGMKVSCYSVYLSEHVTGIGITLEDCVRYFRKLIPETTILGAKIIRGLPMPQRNLGMLDSSWQIDMIKRMWPYVLPDLKKYDVIWGVEVHAPMRTEDLIKLAKEINSEYFGLVPDFSVWQTKGLAGVVGAAPVELLRECMPYTVHVHAKAHFFDERGEEPNTPYDKLIPIIKEAGFSGYISAEFEGWRLGDFSDSRKIVETHVNLIRKYL